MNIRQAILKAADHIERHPSQFNFKSCDKPECGTPGCALGWIGFYLSLDQRAEDAYFVGTVVKLTGIDDARFYRDMDDLAGGAAWIYDPSMTARGMRRYADKFYPEQTRALIPASVRAIFTMTPAELAKEFA